MSKEPLWRDRKRNWLGLPWTFTIYRFDEERLFIERGFLNQVEDEVRLYRILDLRVTRTFWQRIIGTGTITINSNDKSMKTFALANIKNPKEVKEQLSELVESMRDRKRVTAREYMTEDDCEHEDDEY